MDKDFKKLAFPEEKEINCIKVESKKAWMKVKSVMKMIFIKSELRKSVKNTPKEWKAKVKHVTVQRELLTGHKWINSADKSIFKHNLSKGINTYPRIKSGS